MIEVHSLNGVDVDRLKATIEGIRENPTLAESEFHARNTWIEGGNNRAEINEYHAAGQDLSRDMPFELSADEPPVLLGHDRGPNPVEHLLSALSSCMTTSIIYHAAAKGIKIEELESEFSGDLNLHGFLGLKEDVRPGYETIRARFKVKTDAEAEDIKKFVRYSPVYDVVSRSVPIVVEVEKK